MLEDGPVEKNIVKNTDLDYIYFGSIVEGDNPSSEVVFQSLYNAWDDKNDF